MAPKYIAYSPWTEKGRKRRQRERADRNIFLASALFPSLPLFLPPSQCPSEPLKATAGTTAYSGVNRASHSQREKRRESPSERASERAKKECKCPKARERRGPSFQICRGMSATRRGRAASMHRHRRRRQFDRRRFCAGNTLTLGQFGEVCECVV